MRDSTELYCSESEKLPLTTTTFTIGFTKPIYEKRTDDWTQELLAPGQASELSAHTIHINILERRPWFRHHRPIVQVPKPGLSSVYVHWLYTGKLAVRAKCGDNPNLNYLVDLYLLGAALPDPDFMAVLLEAMPIPFAPSTPQQGIGLAGFVHRTNIIYSKTSEGSPLRRLVVQMWNTCGRKLWYEKRDQQIEVNADFARDVFAASIVVDGNMPDEKSLWACEHHMGGVASRCRLD